MTNAVAYMRCSGESQSLGDTWERQEAAIKKYAEANQIEVAAWFRDRGVTGKMELEGRAGLSECLACVRTQGIGLVLVESSDRLARDLIVAEVVIREFQKIGVRVVSASGGVDLTAGDASNPTAKLIRQILAAVAEFDRCVIVLKMRSAKDRMKAAGIKAEGRKAYGERPEEQPVLREMLKLRAEGATLQHITDSLNAYSHRSRMGKPWSVGAVGKILSRTAR